MATAKKKTDSQLHVLAKSSIVAAIIVFVWGMISWMVLPWHNTVFKSFANEDSVRTVIKSNATMGDGIYIVPNPHPPGSEKLSKERKDVLMKRAHEKMKRGPWVFMSVQVNGTSPEMGPNLLVQFFILLIGAFALSWLLMNSKYSTRKQDYWKRVCFVVTAAMVGCFLTMLPNWNWWGFSCGYTLIGLFDMAMGWFFGGLWIAKTVK